MKAVIFDFDGVIIDLRDIYDKFYEKELGLYAKEFHDRQKERFGMQFKDAVKLIFPNKDLGLDFTKIYERRTKMIISLLPEIIPVDKSLIVLLKELKQNNIPIVIASSNTRNVIQTVLERTNLEKYFNFIVDRDDVTNSKPAPDLYVKACKQLNLAPEDCIVFEDAINGIKSAKLANCKCIAILTKYFVKNDLNEADLVISNFNEINLKKLKEL